MIAAYAEAAFFAGREAHNHGATLLNVCCNTLYKSGALRSHAVFFVSHLLVQL